MGRHLVVAKQNKQHDTSHRYQTTLASCARMTYPQKTFPDRTYSTEIIWRQTSTKIRVFYRFSFVFPKQNLSNGEAWRKSVNEMTAAYIFGHIVLSSLRTSFGLQFKSTGDFFSCSACYCFLNLNQGLNTKRKKKRSQDDDAVRESHNLLHSVGVVVAADSRKIDDIQKKTGGKKHPLPHHLLSNADVLSLLYTQHCNIAHNTSSVLKKKFHLTQSVSS